MDPVNLLLTSRDVHFKLGGNVFSTSYCQQERDDLTRKNNARIHLICSVFPFHLLSCSFYLKKSVSEVPKASISAWN